MRRRLTLKFLPVILVLTVAPWPAAPSHAVQSLMSLSFPAPPGGTFAQAAVAVYARPGTPSPVSRLPLLASGRTDSQGNFAFVLPNNIEALVGPLDPAGADGLNAYVRAVDSSHRWLATWDVVLPVLGPFSTQLPANVDLLSAAPELMSASDELIIDPGIAIRVCAADPDGGDPGADEVEPEPDDVQGPEEPADMTACVPQEAVDALPDQLSVPPPVPQVTIPPPPSPVPNPTITPICEKIGCWTTPPTGPDGAAPLAQLPDDWHLDAENYLTESAEVMADDDSTRRWVKIAQQHISPGVRGTFVFSNGKDTQTQTLLNFAGQGWRIGGWAEEAEARSSTFFSTPKTGPYHRVRLARYRYVKEAYVKVHCTPFPPPPAGAICHQFTEERWYPHHWTGAIERSDWEPGMPPWDEQHELRLPRGAVFSTKWANNVTFGVGVELLGFGLKSQTGYSDITRLVWEGVDGCQGRRTLYGAGKDPADAEIIYSRCVP